MQNDEKKKDWKRKSIDKLLSKHKYVVGRRQNDWLKDKEKLSQIQNQNQKDKQKIGKSLPQSASEVSMLFRDSNWKLWEKMKHLISNEIIPNWCWHCGEIGRKKKNYPSLFDYLKKSTGKLHLVLRNFDRIKIQYKNVI